MATISIDKFKGIAHEAIGEFQDAYGEVQTRDGKKAFPDKHTKDDWWQLFVDFMSGNEPFDDDTDDDEDDDPEDDDTDDDTEDDD